MTDWIVVQAAALDLQQLKGARVDALDLEERRLLLGLRGRDGRTVLALDTRPGRPALYLQDAPPQRGQAAGVLPWLRRQLEGARLTGVHAPFGERALVLCLAGRDRFGDLRLIHLVGEFYGTHADVVVAAEGKVLFSLQRRRCAPGDPYRVPGPKPPPGRTLASSALRPAELLARCAAGAFAPQLVLEDGAAVDVLALPAQRRGCALRAAPSMLAALSELAAQRARSEALADLSRRLRKDLERRTAQTERSLARKREEYAECALAAELRRQGEALKAHLGAVPAGVSRLRLPDPTAPGQTLEVPLDPEQSPKENMEALFRRYRKLRTRGEHLSQDLARLEDEEREVQALGRRLAAAKTLEELQALYAERLPKGPSQGRHERPRGPLRFTTQGGHEVLVGRSAAENDALRRSARPSDLWFHAKDRQGAHCILRPLPGRAVGAPDRLEAALLAAYYSRQRRSEQVPVDFTYVRHLRKPRGAAEGFVRYDHHETIFVTPAEPLIQAIRDRSGNSRC